MPSKLKGIIFDIDGTLTSTNDLIFESFRFISKKYLNKSLTNEEILSLFGPTEDVIIKKWFGDNFEDVKKDYYDFYLKNHEMADLYPGIKEILEFLKQKKIILSIFTGKGKQAAAITLKELNIYNYFDLIVTGDDVKEHKPSAEGINLFLEKFNLNKDEVIMIGDSIVDVKASRASGIKIASVLWDSLSKEKVLNANSDYYFHSVKELKDFFVKEIN